MEFNIGSKLRTLRKQKDLSILRLSELAEVSTGQISQIERGLVTPSVVNLWKISQALQVDLEYFFNDKIKKESVIIRKGEHRKIIINKDKDIYEILSPDGRNHQIDFMKIVLKPYAIQKKGRLTHEGEECGYVLSGVLTIQLMDREYELYEGDSIYFNSSQEHVYINKSDQECVSIWAMTPLFF